MTAGTHAAPLFVILLRPTWCAIYLVESYGEEARGGICVGETSHDDAMRMAWGIEMAGGCVRAAWFPNDRGEAAGKWQRRHLSLYERRIPFSTRVRGTEGYSARERAERLMEAVARVKSAAAKKKRKR